MKFSSAVSLGVCGVLLFVSVAAAQRPAPSTPADDTERRPGGSCG